MFSVDWRHLAGDIVYFNSAFNTRIVGERVGDICIFLKKNGFIHSYDQVHLIGFSLGAHVSTYVRHVICHWVTTSHEQQAAQYNVLEIIMCALILGGWLHGKVFNENGTTAVGENHRT